MRIVIYLLCLSIALLSCISCEDLPAISSHQLSNAAEKIESKPSKHNQDNCSPMCTCNCCGQPLIENVGLSIHNLIDDSLIIKKTQAYNNIILPHFNQNIWQPPKVELFLIG